MRVWLGFVVFVVGAIILAQLEWAMLGGAWILLWLIGWKLSGYVQLRREIRDRQSSIWGKDD